MDTAFRSEERFTQREFRCWLEQLSPDDPRHYELIRARIVMSPPANWRHGGVEAELSRLVANHVRAMSLGHVFGSSTGFELLTGDTLQPDLTFISAETWRTMPTPMSPDGFLPLAPTLAVEILSPSTARRDRTEKLEIYAKNGVEEYWIVDGGRRHVEIFEPVASDFGPARIVTEGNLTSRVLPGFEVSLEQIFASFD